MTRWLPLVLVVVGALVWMRCLTVPFLYDDRMHIHENPSIRHLDNLGEVLAHDRRKMMSLSLAVNFAIGGENPFGYHAFNLAIHLLAALTLFGLVRRTLLRTSLADVAAWLAFTCALIWMVHPLTSQAVAYIIQRGESMMGLFYLLVLYCLVRGAESAKPQAAYVGAVVACLLGMMSKEVMVTAPVVALLYDRTFIAGTFKDALRKRWGLYLALAATWSYLGATNIASMFMPAAESASGGGHVVGVATEGVTPLLYLATQAAVIVHYLRLCVWPHPLVFEYAWSPAESFAQHWPQGLLVLALLGASVWALVKRPKWGFVGMAFFIILAPTSSFVPILHMAFEYRMYLPLACVVVAAVVGGYLLLRKQPQAAVIVAACVIVVLSARTVVRLSDYQSETALWRSVIKARPQNYEAQVAYGIALQREHKDYAGAVPHFKLALDNDPTLEAFIALGKSYEELGDLDAAATVYEQARAQSPRDPTPVFNRGVVAFRRGRMDEAQTLFREAIDLDPQHVRAHDMLGVVLAQSGQLAEAEAAWRAGLKIHPKYLNFAHNLGVVLLQQGDAAEAIEMLKYAYSLDPDNAATVTYLAAAFAVTGQVAPARAAYDEAIRLHQRAGRADMVDTLRKRKAQLDAKP